MEEDTVLSPPPLSAKAARAVRRKALQRQRNRRNRQLKKKEVQGGDASKDHASSVDKAVDQAPPLADDAQSDTEEYSVSLTDDLADVEGADALREVLDKFNARQEVRGQGRVYQEEAPTRGGGGEGQGYYGGDEDYADDLGDDDLEDGGVNRRKLNTEGGEGAAGLSKKKLRRMMRPSVSELKQICAKPEVVESWDTTAKDPATLVFLKSCRNTVPVPAHWAHKRKYLQGKRGLEKTLFRLPPYIEQTRIAEIRSAIEAKDSQKTLKQKMRERVRPRHRKMNIDYQVLHDAFFKYATKPSYTKFGDLYFEGKETEMQMRRYLPGRLTERCKEALGMAGPLDPTPWVVNMQRYGPPPSYPSLVVPGVNAHIPDGAVLGFQPGGWGRPPSMEQLQEWGVTPRFNEVVNPDSSQLEMDSSHALWGQLQTFDSSEDEGGDEDDEDNDNNNDTDEDPGTSLLDDPNEVSLLMRGIEGGTVTPSIDQSGLSSVASSVMLGGLQSEGGDLT